MSLNRDPERARVEELLVEFFDGMRAEEPGIVGLWQKVAPHLQVSNRAWSVTGAVSRLRQWRIRRWAVAGVLVVPLFLASIALILTLGDRSHVASAEVILRKAELAATDPQTAGVRNIVSEHQVTMYFLGDDQQRVASAEFASHVWYVAPGRQRVESSYVELTPDGRTLSRDSSVRVWDGSDYWEYNADDRTASVWRQDPGADVRYQGVLFGTAPGELADILSCRTARVIGEDTIAGRDVDVVELSRLRCGLPLPGSDGRGVLWVDDETGLILKSESYSATGELFVSGETTRLVVNDSVNPEQLSFVPPTGTSLDDRRGEPIGVGTAMGASQPPVVSVEEARKDATFALQMPSAVPDGFDLESVQLYWGNETARRLGSHAEWVLLRYATPDGEWLAITQGFGGQLAGLAAAVPTTAVQGTVDVEGTGAWWVDGSPTNRWQPGVLTLLFVDGDGWRGELSEGRADESSGETISARTALASNALSVEELVSVAGSLD